MPATKVISRCSDTRGDFLIKLAPARCSVTSYFTARQAFRDVVKTTLLRHAHYVVPSHLREGFRAVLAD
jgi:hypothetical protein